MATRTWARGVVTTYSHSAVGDFTGASYSDGTPGMAWTYRRDGSPATVTDTAGVTTFAYGNAGGQASGESVAGGLLDGLTLNYPSANGQRQSFTASLKGATLSGVGYGYDNQGRLGTVSDVGTGLAATYGYVSNSDLIGSITSQSNGATVLIGSRLHDNGGRLGQIAYAKSGGATVSSHAYTYDNANRRTQADREDGSFWLYGYNNRDEVTSAKKHLPGGAPLAGWQQEFDFDNIGTRRWMREGGDANGANLRQTNYQPNELNQYVSIAKPGAFDITGRANQAATIKVNGEAVDRQGDYWNKEINGLDNGFGSVYQDVEIEGTRTGAGVDGGDIVTKRKGNQYVSPLAETIVHDDDGNLTSDGRWIYTWNGENRLIQMETAPGAIRSGTPKERYNYIYDSRGRRIRQQLEEWDAATGAYALKGDARYVYDRWNVVAIVDAAGAVAKSYVWGTDLSGGSQGAGGVGGLLFASDSGTSRSWAYAYDGNGNVSAVVDTVTGATGNYDYDAFGKTIAMWGDRSLASANGYRFSTKPTDGTGLLYYGFRYYMPKTGRWASRDPIEERGGTNLYGFVGNDGVNKIDRFGLFVTVRKVPSGNDYTQHYKVNVDMAFHSDGNEADWEDVQQVKSQLESFWTKRHSSGSSLIRFTLSINVFDGDTLTDNELFYSNSSLAAKHRFLVFRLISETSDDRPEADSPYLYAFGTMRPNPSAYFAKSKRSDTRGLYHEFGHLLGAEDHYKKGGWEKMLYGGTRNQDWLGVDCRTITEILNYKNKRRIPLTKPSQIRINRTKDLYREHFNIETDAEIFEQLRKERGVGKLIGRLN